MKRPATVRIKGANWEALTTATSSDQQPTSTSTLTSQSFRKNSPARGKAKAMLLDLAVRHFRSLQLTSADSRRLASALRRALKGETIDVGPVGFTGRTYSFRRIANAISIRMGEGRMRLPLDAAAALIEPLKGAVAPSVLARTG